MDQVQKQGDEEIAIESAEEIHKSYRNAIKTLCGLKPFNDGSTAKRLLTERILAAITKSKACQKQEEKKLGDEAPVTEQNLTDILNEMEARANAATPGPWHYEQGGGHAHNRIVGAEIVQTNGWPERINGVSNASFSDRICENLGDHELPYPGANIAFIAAARSDVPKLVKALRRAVEMLDESNTNKSSIVQPFIERKKQELAQLLREPADKED